ETMSTRRSLFERLSSLLSRARSLGVRPDTPAPLAKRIELSNLFALSLTPISVIFGAINFMNGQWRAGIGNLLITSAFLVTPLLNHLGRTTASRWFLLVLL